MAYITDSIPPFLFLACNVAVKFIHHCIIFCAKSEIFINFNFYLFSLPLTFPPFI